MITDIFKGLNIIDKIQQHGPKVAPCDKVDVWLPWVHITIGNLKTFLLGILNSVTSRYLQ